MALGTFYAQCNWQVGGNGFKNIFTAQNNNTSERISIDKAYSDALRNKICLFKDITATNKAIFLTMITTFGLVRNDHAMTLVQNDLSMEVLFRD